MLPFSLGGSGGVKFPPLTAIYANDSPRFLRRTRGTPTLRTSPGVTPTRHSSALPFTGGFEDVVLATIQNVVRGMSLGGRTDLFPEPVGRAILGARSRNKGAPSRYLKKFIW